MLINSIKAIMLDFDGVIVESNRIKHDAFSELFKQFPEHFAAIMSYHRSHNAINRHDKFKFIMEKILKQKFKPSVAMAWAQRFSELTREPIINCPYVKGALDFIRYFQADQPLYLASATPQNELEIILRGRRIIGCFKGVFGAPVNKTEMFRLIAESEKVLPKNLLFIGDSPEDWTAAQRFGCVFIGRKSEHPMPVGIKIFNDLGEMQPYVRSLLNPMEKIVGVGSHE